MLKIDITFNGKKYHSFDAAFNDLTAKLLIDNLKQRIKPFEKEIQQAGGTVEIKILPGYKAEMHVRNIPDELSKKLDNI